MLNLLQTIAGLAGQWMANSAEKAKAKQALAVAKIEAKTKMGQSDANWEEQAMSASQDSVKDELWTILKEPTLTPFQHSLLKFVKFIAEF